MNKVVWSSNKSEWETPWDFYMMLDDEFHFELDPAAADGNAKCDVYYTKTQDGLKMSWDGLRVFCNPPYGRSVTGKWVRKGAEARGGVVVMLLPARTDNEWFHGYIYKNPRAEIRFVKGRLKFSGSETGAPFPSMVVIFRGE